MTTAAQTAKARITNDGRGITVHIPVIFRQRGRRRQIISPSGSAPWSPSPRVGPALLNAIVRAYRRREMLESGENSSTAELARAEKVPPISAALSD